MVFVHARNATVKTAMALREKANNEGDTEYFLSDKNSSNYGMMEKKVRNHDSLYFISLIILIAIDTKVCLQQSLFIDTKVCLQQSLFLENMYKSVVIRKERKDGGIRMIQLC